MEEPNSSPAHGRHSASSTRYAKNKARAALFQSGLPPSYWCFAAKTATRHASSISAHSAREHMCISERTRGASWSHGQSWASSSASTLTRRMAMWCGHLMIVNSSSHETSRWTSTCFLTNRSTSNPKMTDIVSIKKMSVSTNTIKTLSLTALHCSKDRQQHQQYRRPLKMPKMKKPPLIPMEMPLTTTESFEGKRGQVTTTPSTEDQVETA
mmetsp:Transcript_31555/g.78147  ORF Transcript_31555/g.78147 Transcript_31555/m.78147 type:complete len:211 (+) Transcript_31555:548-1180(+)